jgi:hypothetical protein
MFLCLSFMSVLWGMMLCDLVGFNFGFSTLIQSFNCLTVGLRVVSLWPCFSGWGVGSEVLLEQVQLDFSFRNKFTIPLPCGLLIDNNTFSKMCFFKNLTGYIEFGLHSYKG